MQLVWRTAVRSVGTLGVAACVLAAVAPARAQPATSDRQGLVQDYCVRCHNDRRLTGGLSLEGVQADDPTAHAEIWEKVLRKLQARSMPPVGSPRPDEVVYAQVIRALELAIDRAACPGFRDAELARRQGGPFVGLGCGLVGRFVAAAQDGANQIRFAIDQRVPSDADDPLIVR